MIPITLITQPGDEPVKIEVREGTTVEEIVREYQDKLPYRVLAAKVNNRVRELTRSLVQPSVVEFLDMRDMVACRIYQNSVSFVYLKAVDQVLGNVRVEIQNSLNKGIYTEIKTREPLKAADVSKIQETMKDLVRADIPFKRIILNRDETFQLFADKNHDEKRRILRRWSDTDRVPVYSCDGFLNYFYGQMVPSTGYVQHFELRKYRNGLLLRFPESSAPDSIPVFQDERKLYQAFGEAKKMGQPDGDFLCGGSQSKDRHR